MGRVRSAGLVAATLGLALLGPLARADEPATYAGKDAAWWTEELRDPRMAPAARIVLTRLGLAAREPLARALGSSDLALRNGAAETLADLVVDLGPVVPQVVALLGTTEHEFHPRLLRILARTDRALEPHVDALVPLVGSPRADVADLSGALLAKMGTAAQAALPAMLERVRDATGRPRVEWLRRAAQVAPRDPRIVTALVEAMGRSADDERTLLVDVAASLHASTPALGDLALASARDPHAPVRQRAARLLGALAMEDVLSPSALLPLLEDGDPSVRTSAARALGSLGSRAAPAVDALTRALRDLDARARVAVVEALASIGPAAEAAWPHVEAAYGAGTRSHDMDRAAARFVGVTTATTLAALSSEHAHLHEHAVRTLASWSVERWNAHAEEVVPAVVAHLRSLATARYERALFTNLITLARGRADAAQGLVSLSGAASEEVRQAAATALGHDAHFTGLLLELFVSSRPVERAFARDALEVRARRGDAHVRDALFGVFDHDEEEVRTVAARLVVRHPGFLQPRTLEPRIARVLAATAAAMLAEPDERGRALSTLSNLDTYAVAHVPQIADLLFRETDDGGDAAAARALVNLSLASPEARAGVVAHLLAPLTSEDRSRSGRAAAAMAMVTEHEDLVLRGLEEALESPSPITVGMALDAAERMAGRAAPLVPVLLRLLEGSPSRIPVVHVANALAAIAPGDERVVRAALAGYLAAKVPDVRTPYRSLLHRAGAAAVPIVGPALAAAPSDARIELLRLLAQHGRHASAARPFIVPLLTDPDPGVATAARTRSRRSALERPDARGIGVLRGASSPDGDVRRGGSNLPLAGPTTRAR
jgi:HEAT repeat protein